MTKTIVISNEKGGVGKTTTVLECTYHAANNMGLKCLVIDLDAQANATKMLTGCEHMPSVFDVLVSNIDIFSVIKPTSKEWGKTLCLPADRRLNIIEPHLVSRLNKESLLKKAIQGIKDNFDLIIIDLAPAINTLTVNALVAADAYLVPSDLSQYSKAGIAMIKRLADEIISSGNNPTLEFIGIVLTSFQKANSVAVRTLMNELLEEYKDKLLDVKIPDSVKVTESQAKKIAVGALDAECSVSQAYHLLTKKMMQKKPEGEVTL